MTHIKMTKQHQSGFTLIEILVSATLGIFLVGGVITNFVSTKNADKTRSAISEMDSNARSAMQILRQTISHAGYKSTGNYRLERPFFSSIDGVEQNLICTDGIPRSSPASGSGFSYKPTADQFSRDQGSKGDVLTVVHLADNPCVDGVESCEGTANVNTNALIYQDCVGGGATRDRRAVACSVESMGAGPNDSKDAKIFSTFYLKKVAGEYVLHCRGNRGGVQPLIEGIKNMQFLYGVREDDGNTRYYEAKKVVSNDSWERVVSVRVGLLLQSSEKNLVSANSDTKEHYILLNKRLKVYDLTRLYRVYTTTINLPNQDDGAIL